MIRIPALRFGKPYTSLEKATLVHHVTGEPVAEVSQVTGSMIARDLGSVARAHKELAAIPVRDLLAMYEKAADYFLNAALPCGDAELTFDQYVRNLSSTTGSPVVFCDRNARKVHYVLSHIEEVIGGLTRGLPLDALDAGYTTRGGRMQAFYPTTDVFGAVLPSNSPGVHSLWVPTIAFKIPLLVKPGREEPWTPYRVLQAFLKAGVPASALAFLPTDHAGAADILRLCGRSMAFGDDRTMAPYKSDHRVEIHGTGYSKFIFGEDQADQWEKHLDVMVEGIAANGGRACVNASAVWTPRNADAIAEGLAKRLAGAKARPWDDPACEVSAFANPSVAEAINNMIDEGLKEPGAVDVTQKLRGTPRLVKEGRVAWLLPTIVRCESPDHPLANKEFLFPYASVIEWPQQDVLKRIGYTLAATVLSDDPAFIADALACPTVERLNIGPLPTNRLTWDQPHEGNLFTHLYKQRALQHARTPAGV
ncbi:aldehyde dehydrogenase family protein [Urbifossiella limnaea]|uniref:Aldehyde dehydrogenase n=1 Tax=Urbifossiella limnaea TaxID=2528023 RepID=A0A517XR68_9BACT|nr:aldehyde dehydrogenase family protein [Urbifossiella limnaea]QDU20008.1 Putative aldehyde dehydrogenase [Urbifossiella limnaea]